MLTSEEKLIHIANAVELLQNTLKCVICLEMLREPVSTRCGHHFCNLCLSNHLNHKKTGRASCPLCSNVISRRAIVQNDKIRRQVEGVHRLIKAIEADMSMDITLLRQTRSSTNEANSPVAGPIRGRNQNPMEIAVPDSLDTSIIEDKTPRQSAPPKISSAEKVKTWLIQNKDDFKSKNILNEFSNSGKPAQCDEDSDNDMISVSQIENKPQSNFGSAKAPVSTGNISGKPVRRSLKIKEINQLTSGTTSKSTSGISDKLLLDAERASVTKPTDKSTVSKANESFLGKKTLLLSNNKHSSVSKGSTHAKNANLTDDLDQSCGVSYQESSLIGQSSKNDVAALIHDKDIEEAVPLEEEMPQEESSHAVRYTAQQSSRKPSPVKSLQTENTGSSGLDSCGIIPPSEYGIDLRIPTVRLVKLNSGQANETVKKNLELSNSNEPAAKCASKRTLDQKDDDPPKKKLITSSGSGVAFSRTNRIGVSKTSNVRFIQCARVVRERRFLPIDIRCHCLDKVIFLVDFMEPETKIRSVSPKTSIPVAEVHSIGIQTTSNESNQEFCTAEDISSEDLFPSSPEKIVQSGGEIVARRSNSSSVVSDSIMDAVTVLLSQPPRQNLHNVSSDTSQQEPEKSLLPSPSESLLTKKPKITEESNVAEANEKLKIAEATAKSRMAEATEKSKKSEASGKFQKTVPVVEIEEIGNSDSDEESIGALVRKSAKRPRQLSSSDDSEYGEQKIGRKKKKKKKSPLSDSEKMSVHLEEELPLSLLDQTLESPTKLVRAIQAKIAAGMLDRTDEKIQRRTSPRSSPRTPRISRQMSKLTDVDLTTPPRKKPSSDSDLSDCELLEGTPQLHASTDTSRRTLRSAEESPSVYRTLRSAEESPSVNVMDTTIVPTESLTPGFVDPTQPAFYVAPPIFDSAKKSGVETSGKNILDKSVRETKTTPERKRERTEKTPTPQRALREKNTTEESMSRTLNNISNTSRNEESFLGKKKEATPRALQKLPLKNPTPRKPAQTITKLCFVCSGLPVNLTAHVQKLAVMVSADFSAKFDSKTTHLIVKTKEDNTTDKTLKYLCAVAAKKWVVSLQWVLDSKEKKMLLPEEKYEVLDTTGAEGPRLSRLSPKLLFSGFEFCVIPPLSDLTKQQLEELLQMCGATVISDPKKFSFQADVLPLCLAEWDDEREQEYESWIDRYCVPLIQHEWALECIGRFSLISFWNLLMSDVTDESLRKMGYPPELVEHPPCDSTDME